MKNKPTMLPKAVVAGLHFSAKGHPLFLSQCAIQGGDTYPWCLVLPCSSRKEANQRKKWANLSYEQKVEAVAKSIGLSSFPQAWERWHDDSKEHFRAYARALLSPTGESHPTPK